MDKEEPSLAAVIARHVLLTQFDADKLRLQGACPFHPDAATSLFVHDGLWHCFGCGSGGNATEWDRRVRISGSATNILRT